MANLVHLPGGTTQVNPTVFRLVHLGSVVVLQDGMPLSLVGAGQVPNARHWGNPPLFVCLFPIELDGELQAKVKIVPYSFFIGF